MINMINDYFHRTVLQIVRLLFKNLAFEHTCSAFTADALFEAVSKW